MKDKMAELIAQLRGNSVEAFDRLIEQYGDRLYWHIRRVVVQHEEAEDVLQETFARAYTSIDDFRGDNESSLTAWLYRIATNLAINALRVTLRPTRLRCDCKRRYLHYRPSNDWSLICATTTSCRSSKYLQLRGRASRP